jgi:hypothetical protein
VDYTVDNAVNKLTVTAATAGHARQLAVFEMHACAYLGARGAASTGFHSSEACSFLRGLPAAVNAIREGRFLFMTDVGRS